MKLRYLAIALLFVCISGVVRSQNQPEGKKDEGSEAAAISQQASVSTFHERNPRYEIRPGDSLDIAFAFSPEFNQTVPVQPDGFITLRDAGDVHVAGMTVPDVRVAISQAYSKVLKQPEVTVQLKDFEKPYFIATGQVVRPGKYELRGATRVTEALAMAGGFNDSAKHSKVVLFRHVRSDLLESKVIDIKKMLADKNLNEDLLVNPGDLIYVPQSASSKFRRFIPVPGVGIPIP